VLVGDCGRPGRGAFLEELTLLGVNQAAVQFKDVGAPSSLLAFISEIGLYTRLTLPMLYGVWHTKGGAVWGGCIAQWSCNIVLQYGMLCRWGGQ